MSWPLHSLKNVQRRELGIGTDKWPMLHIDSGPDWVLLTLRHSVEYEAQVSLHTEECVALIELLQQALAHATRGSSSEDPIT
jgi:hypothetical protein